MWCWFAAAHAGGFGSPSVVATVPSQVVHEDLLAADLDQDGVDELVRVRVDQSGDWQLDIMPSAGGLLPPVWTRPVTSTEFGGPPSGAIAELRPSNGDPPWLGVPTAVGTWLLETPMGAPDEHLAGPPSVAITGVQQGRVNTISQFVAVGVDGVVTACSLSADPSACDEPRDGVLPLSPEVTGCAIAPWIARGGGLEYATLTAGFPDCQRTDGIGEIVDRSLYGTNTSWFVDGARRLGQAGGSVGDVDANGEDDLVVASDRALYAVTFTSVPGRHLLHMTTMWVPSTLPSHIGPAGDVDGDGFDDALVLWPDRISVFRGRPAGLTPFPAWSHSTPTGTTVRDAVVLHGDGQVRLLASIATSAGGQLQEWTDWDDTTDTDGDGWADVDDCAPADAAVSPDAQEIPGDFVDGDCDGLGDDIDEDGDGAPATWAGGDDCDDDDPNRAPGFWDAPYDGYDFDCDESTEFDVDADGYEPPPWGEDCDDTDPLAHPGADEIFYDGIDQDCEGPHDEYDADGDGYDAVPIGDDCDDTTRAAFPGNQDPAYDGIDGACDGPVGEWDLDGDGHDRVPEGADCDDSDPAVGPFAVEVPYSGIDEDCDGYADDFDLDSDGAFAIPWGQDCDDDDPRVGPHAREIPADGVDQDCDGVDGLMMELEDLPVGGDITVWVRGAKPGATVRVAMGPPAQGPCHEGACFEIKPHVETVLGPADADGRQQGVLSVAGAEGDAIWLQALADGQATPPLSTVVGPPLCGAWQSHTLTSSRDDRSFWGTTTQDYWFLRQLGNHMASAGDLDGDGLPDLVLTTHDEAHPALAMSGLLHGEFHWSEHPESVLATTLPVRADPDAHRYRRVAGGVDLDGDGHPNVVQAQSQSRSHSGVAVYAASLPASGSPTGAPVMAWILGPAWSSFGAALEVSDDLTGDGLPDLVVAAPDARGGRGVVYVLAGPLAGNVALDDATHVFVGRSRGDALGTALEVADVNGDGQDDLLLGAPHVNGAGAVYGFHGPIPSSATLTQADLELRAAELGREAGAAMAVLDFNGDGEPDLAIGGPGVPGADGRLFLVMGPIPPFVPLEQVA